MKTINAIITLTVTALFGAIVGILSGFNPIYSALTTILLSALSIAPQGVARSGPDVSQVVAQLGQYITVNKSKIWAKIRQGNDLIPYMRGQSGVTGFYSSMLATTTELHQSFQKGLQFKGTPSIEAFKNQNFHVKIDAILDDMDKLWNGYLNFLANEEAPRKEWPFVRYIIDEVLIPKMIEETNDMHCLASYVAPTPGTANAYMETMNGLFTIVTNLIGSGGLTPITVGAMNDTNGVDKVRLFMQSIPQKYKNRGGSIFTSIGKQNNYKNHYRNMYLNSGLKDDRDNTIIDGEKNVKIIGLSGAGASNRMIFIPGDPKEKLIHLYNSIAVPDRLEVQASGRDLILLHDRWDGVGFENLDGVFTSDIQ